MIPTDTYHYAEEFIEALVMQNSIWSKDTITLLVTPEEQKSAWKKQKSSTASKSTTLTYEHQKIVIFDKSLNLFDCTMRSITTEFGFVPPT